MTIKLAVSKFALKRKIPQGDPFWHVFNGSFVNTELNVPELMKSVYRGQAITTQHKEWRKSENYLLGQHLALDLDSEDEKSTIAWLRKDKFISKYAAFVHTTISHTPETPRARVVFTLDEPIMQAKNYALAAQSLLWLYGSADRQCKDPVRFFYGAPGCEMIQLDNVLPLEIVKKLIANYRETGQLEKRHASRKDYVAPPSQQEVADALRRIPPWSIDYDEWVQVLMGIHHAFGDAGLPLAENWGDGQPGEVLRKWQSFKDTGNVAGAITVATVFGIAKRFGWTREKVLT